MSAKECMMHRWLTQDETSLDVPLNGMEVPVNGSPFGSPLGQRRALTPTTPDSSIENEPSKKCRCDSASNSPGTSLDRMCNGEGTSLDRICNEANQENSSQMADDESSVLSPCHSCQSEAANQKSASFSPANQSTDCIHSNLLNSTDNVVTIENINNKMASTTQCTKIEDLCVDNKKLSPDKDKKRVLHY